MRKAQHKGKRVLASALCVGMLASMVPTQAFAADEQPVAAVVQEAAPAAEEAPAEDAVSTETPAEESAAEETPAPAEDAPTEETPVEEAPAEEAALAPMDAPVEEALAAEETAAPAAQEAAAPQTAAARIATNVGVVPAGIDWADNVTANTFAEPYATVTAKDIPCPLLVLRLLLFPAGEFVHHCAGQRNRAARVFRFGCAEYDFSFVLTVVGFVLGKAINRAPDMKLRGRKVNIFPLQC